MAEERTGPRKGGTRTLNPDGTEVKPAAAPVPKPKTESAPKAAKKKDKE